MVVRVERVGEEQVDFRSVPRQIGGAELEYSHRAEILTHGQMRGDEEIIELIRREVGPGTDDIARVLDRLERITKIPYSTLSIYLSRAVVKDKQSSTKKFWQPREG